MRYVCAEYGYSLIFKCMSETHLVAQNTVNYLILSAVARHWDLSERGVSTGY